MDPIIKMHKLANEKSEDNLKPLEKMLKKCGLELSNKEMK